METQRSIYSTSAEFKKLFETCFHEYYEGLHRYAFTIVRENEQAKDIVQSVFCKWWEKRKELNIDTSIKSYLYKAVYNQSLNHIRNTKNRKTYTTDFSDNKFDGTVDTKDNLEYATELECQLKNAIDKLPAQCRIIFFKSKFELKKYSEIADELSISVKTVEVHIGKAYKFLRNKLTNSTNGSVIFFLPFFIS